MHSQDDKKLDSELLDKLISDYGPEKYRDIIWAMEWARVLRTKEEYRRLPMAEMIEKAMLEVISGKVKTDQIKAALLGMPAGPNPKTGAAGEKDEPKKEKKEKKVKAE